MSYEPHQRTPLSGYTFDDTGTRYRLCCCHVKTWAWVIGILEAVSLIINLFGGIGPYAAGGGSHTDSTYGFWLSGLIGGIISFIIGIIVLILFFYGLKKERSGFLIPHLVLQIIAIILLFLAALGYFVLTGLVVSGDKTLNDNADWTIGYVVGFGIIMVIAAAIEIFFLYAIYRAYRYLKDKEMSGMGHMPMGTSYSSTDKGRHMPIP